MNNGVEIMNFGLATQLIAGSGGNVEDFDHQLPTNLALIYKLKSGQVVMVPMVPAEEKELKCLIFKDEACFADHQAKDEYPIENYSQKWVEVDVASLKQIHIKIPAYQGYLNKRYTLEFKTLDRQVAQQYYTNVLHDKHAGDAAVVALAAVMGEALRNQIDAKWILQKEYGPYNPYYTPMLLSGDKVVDVFDVVYVMVRDKAGTSDTFFDRIVYYSKKTWEDEGRKLIEL